MTSIIDIKHRLVGLDRKLHSILGMLKVSEHKKASAVLESSYGAWDYDVDSETFVDQLRRINPEHLRELDQIETLDKRVHLKNLPDFDQRYGL